MATKSQTEKAEAVERLRKILKPGDRIKTILLHVSASGMSRRIDLHVARKGELIFLTGLVGKALEYKHSDKGGLVVGGCGMDMGYHLVHDLGYVLYGYAEKATGRKGESIRRKLLKACRSYIMQGGRKDEPDVKSPSREWFGAAGYALKHDWI